MMRFFKKRSEVKNNMAPAKIGLVAFLAVCLGILFWDMAANGYLGGIDGEQPVVGQSIGLAEPSAGAEPEAESDAEVAEVVAAYFAAYRMDREQARGEETAMLQALIADPGASPTLQGEAEQRLLAIAAALDREAQAESVLDAKGFGESVVMMGADKATVIVSMELDAAAASSIAEIVSSACDINYENVVIVNR